MSIAEQIREAALTWKAFDLLMYECLEGRLTDVFFLPGEWKLSESKPDDLRVFWLFVACALEG